MRHERTHRLSLISVALFYCAYAFALDSSLEISQYAHRSWTVRDGYPAGAVFAMAQTPDGYLWLGSEFGLFRFDGVHFSRWQPPSGQSLPDKPYSLMVSRDGTLWIGTFAGLASWDGKKLTEYPEVHSLFVTSLVEGHDGTVWAGILSGSGAGRLCSVKGFHAECDGKDGTFGSFVWSLAEDGQGTLWVGAETGLWRWRPGPPRRVATTSQRVADIAILGDGQPVFAINGAGLKQVVAEKVTPFAVRGTSHPNLLLSDHDIDSNKLLRDRDAGLWIGTHQRGLIHVHNGLTDTYTKEDGLSGNLTCSLFEDREGNVWFASSIGLDKFRALPVTTLSTKQGLSSDSATSLVAASDGSVWIGSHDGLTRWKDGHATKLHPHRGLPNDEVQSLYEDSRGRVWGTLKGQGLAQLNDGRVVRVVSLPSEEVYSITGDQEGNLWLSGNKGLTHIRNMRVVETLPWAALGRQQQAKAIVFDPARGGLWLAFWQDGGVMYFKDGRVLASYTAADGLGRGHVAALRLDQDGAIWASTEDGGLSRIKDERVATLTSRNGLPCDTIHWSIEDDDRSMWLYTACGLVRIRRSEVETWIADSKRTVTTTLWNAVDGVSVRSISPAYFSPIVAKSADGRLWFNPGQGIQVVDPHHLPVNKFPPPVHIERVIADQKTYWQKLPGSDVATLLLPSRIKYLTIDYTALSLVSPQKVRFKYKLEGQDTDWREVVNDREVQYSNLSPGSYKFHVIASNDSGVWNEKGDTLEFSIAPAYYQANWFRVACLMLFMGMLWIGHHLHLRRLQHDFQMTLDARVGERTRVARDLHDTLLQSFQGLLPRLQAAIYQLPEGCEKSRKTLEEAVDRAAEAITEGRDAVQGLRMSTVEQNDLAQAIETLGQELRSGTESQSQPQFSVLVEGASRSLHPILRDEVYRIAAEALRNAFRHAAAENVEVELRYDHRYFRLRIRDDGKGIQSDMLVDRGREGHFGLSGMRERSKLVDGNLTIWSEVDGGTEIELVIPATRAYMKVRRLWYSWKRSPEHTEEKEPIERE